MSADPETQKETYHVDIAPAEAGNRLDAALTRALQAQGLTLSRARVQALIAAGLVTRAGATLSAAGKVKAGEHYLVHRPAPLPATPEAQAIPLDVIYEDDDVIVIDKPAGLVVHPAAGNPDRTLVNALIAHCGASLSGIGGMARPGIVHRLDKDTSGLLVAAKSERAHLGLAAQFAAHGRDGRLERSYLAVVWGRPYPEKGQISANIGRSPTNRKSFAVVASGGKTATTHYEVIRPLGPAASLVRCRLETGRTHQIRVHMAHLGHPLLGDPVYGARRGGARPPAAVAAAKLLGRQALHATTLGFHHPVTGRELCFESPLPSDIKDLTSKLEQL